MKKIIIILKLLKLDFHIKYFYFIYSAMYFINCTYFIYNGKMIYRWSKYVKKKNNYDEERG